VIDGTWTCARTFPRPHPEGRPSGRRLEGWGGLVLRDGCTRGRAPSSAWGRL